MLEKYLPESLKKFEGIIRFVIVLFAANFLWKISMQGDENSDIVTLWGINCSVFFDMVIHHLAELSCSILDIFGYKTFLYETSIFHENGEGVTIIWGCSGIKQSFIFLCILLFSRGKMIHKLWYAVLGLVVVYLVNLTRIVLLAMLTENHSEYFHFAHEYFFKYLFYFIIFMMWVLWEDFLVGKLAKKTHFIEGNESNKGL